MTDPDFPNNPQVLAILSQMYTIQTTMKKMQERVVKNIEIASELIEAENQVFHDLSAVMHYISESDEILH